MEFTKTPFAWNNKGTAPSNDLKSEGFQENDRPPASFFNYFISHTEEAIDELQDAYKEITVTVDDDNVVNLTGAGDDMAVTITAEHAKKGPSTTASTTKGPTADVTIEGYGSEKSIKIPKVVTDPYGHTTGLTEQTLTIKIPQAITPEDLGLSSAMKFLGTTTTAITDGSTTNPIKINNKDVNPTAGNVVLYNNQEFVWADGGYWELLGSEGSYKVKQTAVSSPSANGTATAFIDTITQNENGVITATKKNLPSSLKNPNALNIKGAGTLVESYDGSAVGEVDFVGGSNVTINGEEGKITISSSYTDTKVTSVDNHYTPTANSSSALSVDANSSTAATWGSTDLVTGVNIQRDAKGHVTGVTVDSIQMPANPDTHHTSTTVVTNSASGKTDTTSALTNGNVYVNHIENNTVRGSYKMSGSGATTVTTDASGNIVVSSPINQNAFSNVKVGSTTIAADTATDTLELVAGDNITLTPDATNDKVTINAKDSVYKVETTGEGNAVTELTLDSTTNTIKGLKNNSFLPLSGGNMTGVIDASNTINVLDFGTSGWIRGKTTSGNKYDIFGYTTPTQLQVGSSYPALSLKGKNTRPTYNGTDMALYSDIPTVPNGFSNIKIGSTTIAADTITDTLELTAGNNITLTPDATNDKVTIAATVPTIPNGFANVKVGSTTVAADTTTDTLELVAGSNITLTPDATNDKVTINAKDSTYKVETTGEGNAVTELTLDSTTNTVKGLKNNSFLPLSGGNMTGELGIKQGGVGIQLGTSGNICATDSYNGGGTTRTILGAGIHWATDAATEDEMTVGHPVFHLAMRGSSERPTYCAGTSKSNNVDLALYSDIPTIPNGFSNIKVGSTTIAADTITDTLTLTAGDSISLTPDATNDGVTIGVNSSNFTPTSILPRDEGEIKTKYRIANKGYTGSADTIWYYKLCDFPVNNSGNYASAILSGRIGGWTSSNESYINALAWNRDTPGISLIDIAGLATASSQIWSICDLVLYSNGSTVSGTTASLYLKCKGYFVYDLDLELYQSNAIITYDGTYTTTTPTGTLAGSASNCKSRMEVVNGKLFVSGKEMASIASPAFTGTPTAPTPSSDNNSTQLATTAFVQSLISDVLTAEVTFKGVTSTLPSSPVNGDIYKVNAAIAQASNMDAAAKVGDTIIYYAKDSKWYVIPSGDTDSDTWRQIRVEDGILLNNLISSGDLTFRGGTGISLGTPNTNTIKINHADYVGTTGEASSSGEEYLSHGDTLSIPSIHYNAQGHITEVGSKTHHLPSLTVATSEKLGAIKSGGDISIDAQGIVSVLDNSHNHTNIAINAEVGDDGVVVLEATDSTNAFLIKGSHAKKGPSSGYTSGNTVTSISGAGASGSIKIPQITVDSYGHVTAAADETVTLTMPSYTLGSFGVNATATELNYMSGVTSGVQSQLNKKANDYSISLYNGTSGNPKPVKFLTVNYTDCDSNNAVFVKIGMVSGHGNAISYTFLQDAIIKVAYNGTVEVDNFKYFGANAGTYDNEIRQYGDIFWVLNSTDKIVDFYCLMGQYSTLNMIPAKRLNGSSAGTVTQHTSCTVYSSGTKVYANNSDIALMSDVPTINIGGRNLIAKTDDSTVFSGAAAAGSTKDVWSSATIAPPTGTEYIVSFDAKADVAMDISCYFYSPNTTLTSESSTGTKRTGVIDGSSSVSVTTEWKRYWVKWTQTAASTVKQVIVGRNSSTSTLYIRAVKLEEGNMPTSWTPAPEDMALAQNYLPLWGGKMTGEIAVGQGDGKGIQLGTDGRINATSSSGSTTCTVLGLISNNAYVGHSSFNLALRGSKTNPTYNGNDLALYSDIASIGDSRYVNVDGDTMTKALTMGFSNPHIKFVDSDYPSTSWYLQAYQDTFAFGPTYASAVVTDKSGNMKIPGTMTVENKVKLDYDSTNECLNFVFI